MEEHIPELKSVANDIHNVVKEILDKNATAKNVNEQVLGTFVRYLMMAYYEVRVVMEHIGQNDYQHVAQSSQQSAHYIDLALKDTNKSGVLIPHEIEEDIKRISKNIKGYTNK